MKHRVVAFRVRTGVERSFSENFRFVFARLGNGPKRTP